MKCLATGGSGFIGSHLVERLLSRGDEVIIYDNLSSGKAEFLDAERQNPGLEIFIGDLLEKEKLWTKLKGVDFVFHLAANPDIRSGLQNTALDLEQNTLATYNVLEGMRRADVPGIALASSSTVYGRARKIPTPEDYGPLLPESLYGASKLACEALVSSFSSLFGMRAYVFRFANIVGARATHGVLVDFLNKLRRDPARLEVLGDGEQRKSFLKVEECIDGMLFAMRNLKEKVNVLNLGSNDQVSVGEIARMALEVTGVKAAEIRFKGGRSGWVGDIPEMLLDVSKMDRLGWRAKRTSAQAVHEAFQELLPMYWAKEGHAKASP